MPDPKELAEKIVAVIRCNLETGYRPEIEHILPLCSSALEEAKVLSWKEAKEDAQRIIREEKKEAYDDAAKIAENLTIQTQEHTDVFKDGWNVFRNIFVSKIRARRDEVCK